VKTLGNEGIGVGVGVRGRNGGLEEFASKTVRKTLQNNFYLYY